MNKKGMSIPSAIILMLALTIGAAVTVGDISIDQAESVKRNLSKGLENISFEETFSNVGLAPDLEKAAEYYLAGIFRAYEHITYWIIDYTIRHPDIPYKLLLYIFIFSILSPLILLLFKLIIIIFLLIKEFFQNRKDKKKLKCLKQKTESR